MGGRHAATTQLTAHRDFKERSVVLAVAHPKTLGRLPLPISLRSPSPTFSLQPSCHLAVVPLSSFSLLSLPPLSRRSPLPRSATPPPPADPVLSRLLPPLGATPPSSRHILAPLSSF